MRHSTGELSDALEVLRSPQLLLAAAALGHIDHDPLEIARLAVLAVEDGALLLDPDPGVVGPAQTVGGGEATPLAIAGLRLLGGVLDVLGVHPREPETGIVGPRFTRKTGEALDLRADVDHRRRFVEAPEVRDRRDLLDQGTPAALGRAPRLVGPLALGDVAQVAGEEQPFAKHGDDGQLDRELGAVAAQSRELEAPAENLRLGGSVRRHRAAVGGAVRAGDDQGGQLLADRLDASPAEGLLRSLVPLDHESMRVDHDHRVERGVDHSRLNRLALGPGRLAALPVGHVLDNPVDPERPAVGVSPYSRVHVE